MGLFSWLFGPRISNEPIEDNWGRPRYSAPHQQAHFRVRGSGDFDFEVVGEGHYQPALLAVAGPKTDKTVEHYCDASLIPEPSNPHDKNAVAVKIRDRTVGYLSRRDARDWHDYLSSQGRPGQTAVVSAVVVGGWKRSNGDEGSFGVRLDID